MMMVFIVLSTLSWVDSGVGSWALWVNVVSRVRMGFGGFTYIFWVFLRGFLNEGYYFFE